MLRHEIEKKFEDLFTFIKKSRITGKEDWREKGMSLVKRVIENFKTAHELNYKIYLDAKDSLEELKKHLERFKAKDRRKQEVLRLIKDLKSNIAD